MTRFRIISFYVEVAFYFQVEGPMGSIRGVICLGSGAFLAPTASPALTPIPEPWVPARKGLERDRAGKDQDRLRSDCFQLAYQFTTTAIREKVGQFQFSPYAVGSNLDRFFDLGRPDVGPGLGHRHDNGHVLSS